MINKQAETRERILEARRKSIEGWASARETTLKVMRYVRHQPYTQEEIDAAEANAKPLLRYAILIGKLMTLLGNEQNNRREVKIIADYFTQEEIAKLLSDNRAYIKEINQWEALVPQLLADALLYPTLGWVRRLIKMGAMGYLDFQYKLYDTLMVHPSKEFRRMDLMDCSYVVADDWLTWNQIENKYKPSKLDKTEYKRWWENIEESRDIFQILSNKEDDTYKVGDQLLVCEMEVRREVPVNVVELETGEYVKLTDKELDEYEKQGERLHFVRKDVDDRIFVESTVPAIEEGCTLLEKEYPYPTKRFSFFPCASFNWNTFKSKQTSWGDLVLDPQDRINKGKSQEVDYLIQKLGSLWHVHENEKTAINDLENAKGNPWGIVKYKNLQRNKAVRDTGSVESGSIMTIQQSIAQDRDLLNDISKITIAMEGGAGKSGETGVLFDQKLTQSLVSTNPYYEILNLTDENLARDYLELVPYVYFENDRLLPLKGSTNRLKYEMINLNMGGETLKNMREFSARAVLDAVENIPNRLNQAFNENVAFAQMLINAGFPPERIPFMLIVKNSTIRDKKEWVDALSEAQHQMAEQRLDERAMGEMEKMMQLTNNQEKENI